MSEIFRIHGDNIVECERIAKLILDETRPNHYTVSLLSPSTLVYILDFEYEEKVFSWELHLLPGFNKAGRHRWPANIFTILRENGSFLDETPDAVVTMVNAVANTETILYAIEFCSALQAGNQAWQRSGRAFSTGRTSCPYLYIVDFVKYELNPHTRERKALRFPNPAVPYSYINFSEESSNFVAQVYVRSEEFDKDKDSLLANFNENDFAEQELSAYIVKLMCGFNTEREEAIILKKNFNVVLFLAQNSNPNKNFTESMWRRLKAYDDGIINFSLKNSHFNFHKTITVKGHHGKSQEFLDLVDEFSIGIASKDLPFGIIPANKRKKFARHLSNLYPKFDWNVIDCIAKKDSDLILCIIKGFKPGGDDNRPDRGVLPLAAMLMSTDVEIMTYIYGPVVEKNYNLLLSNPRRLAGANGFWKSVLALSNYVALDVPILSKKDYDEELLIDTTDIKQEYTDGTSYAHHLTQPFFTAVPTEYHEDDVDTAIHFIFAHLLHKYCFEGMCNPPGGDWSGLSIIYGDDEIRWLSLPRVSEEVNGKRPDHVLEIFNVFAKPLLLAVESKERSADLEPDVGESLKNYINNLMCYIPNVKRPVNGNGKWTRGNYFVSIDDYIVVSAAAYLKRYAQPKEDVIENSNCDLLILLSPLCFGWEIELVPQTRNAQILKEFLIRAISQGNFDDIFAY